MRCSPLHLLHLLHLLPCLALLLHAAEVKVLTEIQAGPLYRVVGAPLSISCNVSGFADPDAKQNFEFRVKKPSKPNFELNIISTADPGFPYGAYTDRVRSGEVTVDRLSPTSVIFRIESLQKNDEGDYDCSVINSVSVFSGTYSVITTVRVIDDSLSVSSPASALPSYDQGDTLTLSCRASSNTIQHTHLSVGWYLHRDGEDTARPLISLDRDFTLRPGDGFEGRYRAGLLRLDKVGEAVYTLTMAQLEAADQGKIRCQAREWIQDADLSWYPIAKKEAEEAVVNVKVPELVPATQAVAVRLSAQQSSLQEGQELLLTCSVDTQDLQQKFFSVAWLRGAVELARVGPTGVLTAGAQYDGRERVGELRASRVGLRDYRLALKPVRTEDSGEFICRAWLQERGQDGVFTQGAVQDSTAQMINISATERSLLVEMQNAVSVIEGNTLTLACGVRGGKGQLSVAWQRSSNPASAFADVVSLTQEGVAEVAGEFAARRVTATRPAADAFRLEIEGVKVADGGVYRCTASEWSGNSKTSSQAETTTVTVNSLDSLMKVNLISRANTATVGDMVELRCRVRGPRRATTLTWSYRESNSDASTLTNILTVYHDGVISWSGDQNRYQLRVESGINDITYFLLINGISHREAGAYQCMVSVFQENTHRRLKQSNQVAVMVQNPASKLSLKAPIALTGNINTDIEMKCTVTSATSVSSRFAVTWTLLQETQNVTIVSSDRDSDVTLGPLVDPSHGQRISTRRTAGPPGPVFQLTVRQALISDKGGYVCEVVEWLQDPRGEWYALQTRSTTTALTLIEPTTDLQLDQNERRVFVMEGDEPRFECNVTSGASNPSLFYKVTWFYTGSGSAASPLAELDHNGLLRYPESLSGLRDLQGRLRLSRPTHGSFRLGVLRAHEADSGTYRCQVEQYQLDRKGGWEQKASVSGGAVTLSVNVTENKLAIVKETRELNVSRSQDFSVPCHIASLSSPESRLQVTWFWQETLEKQRRPIFHVYRNSTVAGGFEEAGRLMLIHPSPKHFSLNVSRALPENSGVYFCEVEEWLPSLSRGWWRAGVEKSGYLTLSVQAEAEGADARTGCSSAWTGILAGVVVCSLVVICLLALRLCRAKRSEKKAGQSLWAEQPLNGKPNTED